MTSEKRAFESAPGPFQIYATQSVVCPLGQVVLAGTKWDSRATYAHMVPPTALYPTPHDVLVYTLEGEADYVDSTGLKACLRKGSLVWARKGVLQSYGPRPGSRWSEFFIRFGGPLFDAWQAHGFPGPASRLLSLEPLEYWIERFRAVVQPAPAAPEETPLVRLCRLQQILAEALQLHDASRQTAEDLAWREAACRQLAAGTLTRPALPEVAAALKSSYALFRKRFLRMTGKTPGQFRCEEIMRRASADLMESKGALRQIAADLGFHDQFHFSRRFKQVFGISPREFRRQALKR